jgi:hypothetical protein
MTSKKSPRTVKGWMSKVPFMNRNTSHSPVHVSAYEKTFSDGYMEGDGDGDQELRVGGSHGSPELCRGTPPMPVGKKQLSSEGHVKVHDEPVQKASGRTVDASERQLGGGPRQEHGNIMTPRVGHKRELEKDEERVRGTPKAVQRSGGPSEHTSILEEGLISELGLTSAAVLAIEGRMKMALKQARYQDAAEHGDTITIIHDVWEERHLRSADHWGQQVEALNKENEQLCERYQSSVLMQKDLVDKEVELKNKVEVLRREKEVLLMNRNVGVWLETKCPEGHGGSDEEMLLGMAEHLKEAGGKMCERRRSTGQLSEGVGKGGGEILPEATETRGGSKPKSSPSRYTDCVKGGGQGFEPPTGGTAETASQPGGGPSMSRKGPSSRCGEEAHGGGGRGGEATRRMQEEEGESSSMQDCLRRMGQAMVNMQKHQEVSMSRQERLLEQLELKFNAKLSVQKDESMRGMEALTARLEQGSKQPAQCDLGAVMVPSTGGKQRGRYDLPAASSCALNGPVTASVGPAGPMGATQGPPPPGYLAEKISVQKHEANEIGLFVGGEEARTVWPGFIANFKHLAKSYHWDYNAQGVLLARKCRGLALPVLDSLPEKLRQDYNSIVGVFNKAYVPKEWARTYRGALNSRKQKVGESLLKYAAALTICHQNQDAL